MDKSKRLKKDLGLFKVYALATGATLSSGFFLLPGLAAAEAGPAVILSYLIAAIHIIPAVFSLAELCTAMPRAGGVYYFTDRSLGPLLGTIAGIGMWVALILKGAFVLIGMGAYLSIFFQKVPTTQIAVGLAVAFGLVNLFGVKKTGSFQVILVIILLTTLGWFLGQGLVVLRLEHFQGFFDKGFDAIYGTAGLVYVSYVGLTKIASVSEEVKDPEKNLPRGMFLALATAILVYGLGTLVIVGLLPAADLHHDLTPAATASYVLLGRPGVVIMTIAAILSFFSVANVSILSASRYPLAMSRDHLLPRYFRRLTKKYRTPKVAIYATVALTIICLTVFDPTGIAKLASAFQLLLLSLSCLAVVIMRESKLDSYDPGYHSPWYPWMQIFGIVAPLFLIVEMGWYPALFTIGLITVGIIWYFSYAAKHVIRGGAIYHIFARLGERRFEGLDRELRGILKEKGARGDDPFDVIIANAILIDFREEVTFEEVVSAVSDRLSRRLPMTKAKLEESFLQGTRVGATPVSHGVALPHMRLPEIALPEVAIVRARYGVDIDVDDEFLGEPQADDPVYALFFLVSPEENPGQHLRLLAQIAGQMDDDRFMKSWRKAKNEQEMKELLLRDERSISLRIRSDKKTGELAGKQIQEIEIPEGSLIAIIHRKGEIIIPRGRTRLHEGDRLTIIGEPQGIRELHRRFGVGRTNLA